MHSLHIRLFSTTPAPGLVTRPLINTLQIHIAKNAEYKNTIVERNLFSLQQTGSQESRFALLLKLQISLVGPVFKQSSSKLQKISKTAAKKSIDFNRTNSNLF